MPLTFSQIVCLLLKQIIFSVNFSEHLACIGKQATKLCCLIYFWPIHLPIFIPCLVLFRFHYCFMETLSLTIQNIFPTPQSIFKSHLRSCVFASKWVQARSTMPKSLLRASLFQLSISAVYSLPFPVQTSFKSVCKN